MQVKKFVCETCNKKLSRKNFLEDLFWTHTSEKSYVCEVCKKEFLKNSDMTRTSRKNYKGKAYYV